MKMEGTLERGPSNGADAAQNPACSSDAQQEQDGGATATDSDSRGKTKVVGEVLEDITHGGDVPPHEEQPRHDPPTLLAFPDSSIVGAHDSPNAKLRRRLEETSQELYSNIAELHAAKLAGDANPTEEQVELGRQLTKLNRVMQTEIRRRTQAMVQEAMDQRW